jgi:hypothetical protein
MAYFRQCNSQMNEVSQCTLRFKQFTVDRYVNEKTPLCFITYRTFKGGGFFFIF